jgi:maltose alpha-D-glucosyltransferase/alpha-amylase
MTSRPTTPADEQRSPQQNGTEANTLPAWLDQAVLYAVDVPAFRDSDGDGIGDLMGVIDALDDLADLGVTVIWLLPFYTSPRQDNGYDVADHYDVDPRLGTLDDLRRLVREARQREIRIMVDLVANHTSDRHPWFEDALTDPNSPFHDYYVWRDDLDGVPDMEPVFPDFEKSVWTYTERVGAWYLHHFYRFEPDLNVCCEVVQEEIRKIVRFWLELGIDGFRLDAAPFLGDDLSDGPLDPHELLKTIRGWVTEVNPNACLLAEADLQFKDLGAYFGKPGAEEMDALFDFMFSRSVFLALAQETAGAVVRCLTSSPMPPPSSIWVSFLRHADELSLSWLDGDEQHQVFERFAPDVAMQVYGRGIRRRLAPLMGNDWRLVRFCCSLQFSLPGAPLIMYGDEIGLGENLVLPERAAVRTAMQWDAPGATPTRMLLPDIIAREARSIPVDPVPLPEGAAEHRAWLKGLVALRRSLLRDCRRTFELVETGNPHLLVHRYDGGLDPIVCVHNFSPVPQVVHLGDLGPSGCAMFGSGITEPRTIGLDAIELDGHGFIWI